MKINKSIKFLIKITCGLTINPPNENAISPKEKKINAILLKILGDGFIFGGLLQQQQQHVIKKVKILFIN